MKVRWKENMGHFWKVDERQKKEWTKNNKEK